MGDDIFGLQYLANSLDQPRLGMAVSTRVSRTSIVRNRIRRQIRELFRLQQHRLPPADLFITARNAARDASPADMRASLAKLFGRLPR